MTRLHKIDFLGFVGLIWDRMLTASATGNAVPGSRLEDSVRTITPNDLKPAECAGLTLTAKLTGGGSITGTGAAELIVGGPAAQTINGGGAADCILGGGGNDS